MVQRASIGGDCGFRYSTLALSVGRPVYSQLAGGDGSKSVPPDYREPVLTSSVFARFSGVLASGSVGIGAISHSAIGFRVPIGGSVYTRRFWAAFFLTSFIALTVFLVRAMLNASMFVGRGGWDQVASRGSLLYIQSVRVPTL